MKKMIVLGVLALGLLWMAPAPDALAAPDAPDGMLPAPDQWEGNAADKRVEYAPD